VSGKDAEQRTGDSGIVLNKNSIPYDPKPAAVTSGVRVGTPSLTTQGMGVPEMATIASMIGRAVKSDNPAIHAEIKAEVLDLTAKFPAYPRP
jgi:glycine hydroxymethyltransferase